MLESIGDISLDEIEDIKYAETVEKLNNLFEALPGNIRSSADWGGFDVWSVKGGYYEGYFIIDVSDEYYSKAFALMKREFNEETEENIDQDLFKSYVYPENKNLEQLSGSIDQLIEKSLEIKNGTTETNERMSDFDAVATIGKITKQITIELDLKHSMHSMERQGRSTEFIKNVDIKASVDKATPQIIDLLINNTLNAGDAVWIYDTSNDLNVVGSLLANKKTDIITFKVITCMFTKTFYNKNKTYKVTV